MEELSSVGAQDGARLLSPLSDATEVAEAIIGVLSDVLTDHEPKDEDGQRVVFVVGASVHRGILGHEEVDQALRENYLR